MKINIIGRLTNNNLPVLRSLLRLVESDLDLDKIPSRIIRLKIPARNINPNPINKRSSFDVKKYNPKIRVPIINEIKAVLLPNFMCFSDVILTLGTLHYAHRIAYNFRSLYGL